MFFLCFIFEFKTLIPDLVFLLGVGTFIYVNSLIVNRLIAKAKTVLVSCSSPLLNPALYYIIKLSKKKGFYRNPLPSRTCSYCRSSGLRTCS
jgi:hypothetical protein